MPQPAARARTRRLGRLLPPVGGLLVALVLLAFVGCGDPEPPAEPPGPPKAPYYDRDGALVGANVPAARKPRPNLVLVVVDTLRRDALALAGEEGGQMPFASSLAARGVAFRNATAPAPWTVPSLTSLLTGMLPSRHGCDGPSDPPRLLDATTTYAEILRETYGYDTAAYTAGPWISERDTVLQGFSRTGRGFALQGAESMLAAFRKRRDAQRPFCLVLHTYEAHDPYGAENHPWPEPPMQPGSASGDPPVARDDGAELTRRFFLSRRQRLDLLAHYGGTYTKDVIRYGTSGWRAEPRRDLRDALLAGYGQGVRWVDGLIEKTVAGLRAHGLLENTVLVVTSDHGEAFGEHGILGHGRQLYDELVHIPLVMSGPGPFSGGKVIEGSVGLVDVFPTFLDYAGCRPLEGVQGRSFLPLLSADGPGRPVFSEEILDRSNTMEDVSAVLTSVRSARWKYVITFDKLEGTVLEEAYDLAADPAERTDLCRDTGRIEGLTFDAAFCAAIESARDRIWGAAAASNRLHASPYSGGTALVTSKRPEPCK